MKVLVVDDHTYNRDLLGFILEDHEYEYLEANNGSEAIEMVAKHDDIEIVLMDVNMPVMDGYEATRIIKSANPDRYIPIVFVTALDDEETLAKCLSVGGDDFVPKPINENVLVAKVKAHQRTAHFYKELQETNQRLSYHQKLMDREHSIVEHVFQNSMKRVTSDCENVRFHVSPMSMFNGDLILVAPSPSGGVYLLLGDFTGHGLSAAIGCLPVADIFYAMTQKQASISTMAAEINARLQDLLPSNMFFCAAIIEMSAAGDRLSYWVGGMNDLLVVGEQGGIEQLIQAQHMPLGVLESHEFDDATEVVSLPLNSRLFIYTDGVIESQDASGEMFGEERLHQLFSQPADSYVKRVSEAVESFSAGGEQTDDLSIAELVCTPVVLAGASQGVVQAAYEALPWNISMPLSAAELSREDVVARVIKLLGSETQFDSHMDVIFTIVSELYNNALDHGILSLDSKLKQNPEGFESYYQQRGKALSELVNGEISLNFQLSGDLLKIRITDSGNGFDYQRVVPEYNSDNDLSFGRGMHLVRSFCPFVEYSDGGRTVEAHYCLTQ